MGWKSGVKSSAVVARDVVARVRAGGDEVTYARLPNACCSGQSSSLPQAATHCHPWRLAEFSRRGLSCHVTWAKNDGRSRPETCPVKEYLVDYVQCVGVANQAPACTRRGAFPTTLHHCTSRSAWTFWNVLATGPRVPSGSQRQHRGLPRCITRASL